MVKHSRDGDNGVPPPEELYRGWAYEPQRVNPLKRFRAAPESQHLDHGYSVARTFVVENEKPLRYALQTNGFTQRPKMESCVSSTTMVVPSSFQSSDGDSKTDNLTATPFDSSRPTESYENLLNVEDGIRPHKRSLATDTITLPLFLLSGNNALRGRTSSTTPNIDEGPPPCPIPAMELSAIEPDVPPVDFLSSSASLTSRSGETSQRKVSTLSCTSCSTLFSILSRALGRESQNHATFLPRPRSGGSRPCRTPVHRANPFHRASLREGQSDAVMQSSSSGGRGVTSALLMTGAVPIKKVLQESYPITEIQAALQAKQCFPGGRQPSSRSNCKPPTSRNKRSGTTGLGAPSTGACPPSHQKQQPIVQPSTVPSSVRSRQPSLLSTPRRRSVRLIQSDPEDAVASKLDDVTRAPRPSDSSSVCRKARMNAVVKHGGRRQSVLRLKAPQTTRGLSESSSDIPPLKPSQRRVFHKKSSEKKERPAQRKKVNPPCDHETTRENLVARAVAFEYQQSSSATETKRVCQEESEIHQSVASPEGEVLSAVPVAAVVTDSMPCPPIATSSSPVTLGSRHDASAVIGPHPIDVEKREIVDSAIKFEASGTVDQRTLVAHVSLVHSAKSSGENGPTLNGTSCVKETQPDGSSIQDSMASERDEKSSLSGGVSHQSFPVDTSDSRDDDDGTRHAETWPSGPAVEAANGARQSCPADTTLSSHAHDADADHSFLPADEQPLSEMPTTENKGWLLNSNDPKSLVSKEEDKKEEQHTTTTEEAVPSDVSLGTARRPRSARLKPPKPNIAYMKPRCTILLPVSQLDDGTYVWSEASLLRAKYTCTLEEPPPAPPRDEAMDDLMRVSRSAHASGQPPASLDSLDPSITIQRHYKHWQYVDDTIDVAGFDEELKLPSALARDVRFLWASFLKRAPNHGRITENYATLRELSLSLKKAFFFWPESLPTSEFNILTDIRQATAEHSASTHVLQNALDLEDRIERDDVNELIMKKDVDTLRDVHKNRRGSTTSPRRQALVKDESSQKASPASRSRRRNVSRRRHSSSLRSSPRSADEFYSTELWGLARRENDDFRLWGHPLHEGDIIRVLFLHSSTQTSVYQEEEFQWFRLQTMCTTLEKICKKTAGDHLPSDLSTVHLAHYAPTLFWNLVFRFDSDPLNIRQFLSRFTGRSSRGPALRVRRHSEVSTFRNAFAFSSFDFDQSSQRRGADRELGSSDSLNDTDWEDGSSHTKSCSEEKCPTLCKDGDASHLLTHLETRRLVVFEVLQRRLHQRVLLWRSRRRRVVAPLEGGRSGSSSSILDYDRTEPSSDEAGHYEGLRHERRQRRPILQDNLDAVVRAYLDLDGFPKQSLSPVSLAHRRLLYGACCLQYASHMAHNDIATCVPCSQWTAPIALGMNDKGRAVYAAQDIEKDDFICEYAGEYIGLRGIAQMREAQYEAEGLGSYMFYFTNPYSGIICCIDATDERIEYGPARLINHSHLRPNCVAMAIRHPADPPNKRRPEPKLVFIARRFIKADEELLIDYGETNPAVLEANPWLTNT